MRFRLSSASLKNLDGVHPDLVRVVKRAIEITPVDFKVIEGIRTVERQRQLVARGASQTMNSRHIPGGNGYGHAVDIVPLVDGQVSWDWPYYYPLAEAIKKAAGEVGVKVEWGGDWKSYKDGPHWQLPWKQYPSGSPVVAHEPKMEPRLEQQLSRSRTMQGAGTAALGGTVMTVQAVTDAVASQKEALTSGDMIQIAIGVIVVLGALAAAYARWDDAGRPLPWRSS